MYPLPISMIALIAGASLHISSASAETDVPRVPDIMTPLNRAAGVAFREN